MAFEDNNDFENTFGVRLALRQIKQSFEFKGRSTRTEVSSYWVIATVAEVAVSVVTLFVWDMAPWKSPWLFTAMAIVFAIPEPALFVRRLHDQNRSGWWALLGIPYAAFAWFGGARAERALWEHVIVLLLSIMILALLLWSPTFGTNRFAPDPRLDDGVSGS